MDGQANQSQQQPTTIETQPNAANASEVAANASQAQQTPPKEPAGQAGQEEGEGLTDRHGQPAIAKGKYERDLAAKDQEIAELRAQLDERSKTEEGRRELQQEIEKLKAELASDKVDHALELAGCVNTKAARAVLGDYDDDVDKLKEACPYLFAQKEHKQAGSTGLPTGGALSQREQRIAKAREAAGLMPSKE